MTVPPDTRVGIVVNPIAGMGGRVGLKGTDGEERLARARALGAEQVAPGRAEEVVRALKDRGLHATVVTPESAAGTRAAATAFHDWGVDLLLFVGGDGTARDVCEAVGTSLPVLGVPAGVKMHSAVFATGTRSAVEAVISWLGSSRRATREAEVVDVDEAAMRDGRMSVRLHGTLLVPDVPGRIQTLKSSAGRAETAEVAALAAEVVRRFSAGALAILGPGTTTRAVGEALGVPTTLLGVDVVEIRAHETARVVAPDANEAQILVAIAGGRGAAFAVVSPTGGQGFLLGRGNQQLSPGVLRAIGPDRVLVIATPSKLAALGGRPLYVDTGDAALDAELAGYRRVISGPGQEAVVRVDAG